MKYADSKRMRQRIILDENEEAENRTRHFKKQRHEKDRPYQLDDSPEAVHVQRLLGEQTSPDADPLSRGKNQSHAH